VDACVLAMESGTVSDSHYRALLKCRSVNVQSLARFLTSSNPIVRTVAAKIIGALGDVSPLLDAALREEDKCVLTVMLKVLGERGEGLEALERMVCAPNSIMMEEVITMYCRAGQADALFPLLFEKDEHLVTRIKRYINEQEREENAVS